MSQLRVRLKDCLDRHTLHGMRVGNADTKVQCRVDGLASEEPFSEDIEDTASFGSNGVTFTWAGNNEAQGYAHWTVNEERSKTWNRLTDWQTAYPSGVCWAVAMRPAMTAAAAPVVWTGVDSGLRGPVLHSRQLPRRATQPQRQQGASLDRYDGEGTLHRLADATADRGVQHVRHAAPLPVARHPWVGGVVPNATPGRGGAACFRGTGSTRQWTISATWWCTSSNPPAAACWCRGRPTLCACTSQRLTPAPPTHTPNPMTQVFCAGAWGRFNVLESPSIGTAVLEVFVALFFLWYMGVEFMQCRKYGKKYLTSVRHSC